MRTALTILAGAGVVVTLSGAAQQPTSPSSSVTIADYTRAVGLQQQFTGRALNVVDQAVWLPSGKVWYRKSVAGGTPSCWWTPRARPGGRRSIMPGWPPGSGQQPAPSSPR